MTKPPWRFPRAPAKTYPDWPNWAVSIQRDALNQVYFCSHKSLEESSKVSYIRADGSEEFEPVFRKVHTGDIGKMEPEEFVTLLSNADRPCLFYYYSTSFSMLSGAFFLIAFLIYSLVTTPTVSGVVGVWILSSAFNHVIFTKAIKFLVKLMDD